MWICSQTKLITSVSFIRVTSLCFLNWFIESCQLAALKLVEQGKITFDTPVRDYFPQFRNPIIVDRTDTQETSFRPAETVVTLRHLLTMTSGLFTHRDYNSGRISESHCSKEMHRSEDPIFEFFRIVIVRPFFFGYFNAGIHVKSFCQGELPALPLQFEPGTDCKSLSCLVHLSQLNHRCLVSSHLRLECWCCRIPCREGIRANLGAILVVMYFKFMNPIFTDRL